VVQLTKLIFGFHLRRKTQLPLSKIFHAAAWIASPLCPLPNLTKALLNKLTVAGETLAIWSVTCREIYQRKCIRPERFIRDRRGEGETAGIGNALTIAGSGSFRKRRFGLNATTARHTVPDPVSFRSVSVIIINKLFGKPIRSGCIWPPDFEYFVPPPHVDLSGRGC
jgi:hypothetical protein